MYCAVWASAAFAFWCLLEELEAQGPLSTELLLLAVNTARQQRHREMPIPALHGAARGMYNHGQGDSGYQPGLEVMGFPGAWSSAPRSFCSTQPGGCGIWGPEGGRHIYAPPAPRTARPRQGHSDDLGGRWPRPFSSTRVLDSEILWQTLSSAWRACCVEVCGPEDQSSSPFHPALQFLLRHRHSSSLACRLSSAG
jgi:hypothetical protein